MKTKYFKIMLLIISIISVSCSKNKNVISNISFYENSKEVKKGNIVNSKGKDYEKVIEEYLGEFEKNKDVFEVKEQSNVIFKPELSFENNGVKYIFSKFETINMDTNNSWFLKTIKDNKETLYKINVNNDFTLTTNNFKGVIYEYFEKNN